VTNDQPEFEKVIAALRSGANPAELAGEDAALEAMASAFASTPAVIRSFGSARSLRVVAVVAASLIGMGGIAAAGAATLRPTRDTGEISTADTTTPDTADSTTPGNVVKATTIQAAADTTIPVTTVSDLLAEPLVDDPTTDFDETQCAEGNHGATVSSIAKETPPGPGHGDEVSIAAHSSCGKNADDDTTDDTIADDDTTDDTTVAATDDDSPGNSAGHGNSNGHGSGNGNSGGNGNGRGNGKPGG
jgi:hypothetical protein